MQILCRLDARINSLGAWDKWLAQIQRRTWTILGHFLDGSDLNLIKNWLWDHMTEICRYGFE